MWIEIAGFTLAGLVFSAQMAQLILCPDWREHETLRKMAIDTRGKWTCQKCGKRFGGTVADE